ncbi:hypothetical protein P7K49_016969, partial [Saguinus oedipus]
LRSVPNFGPSCHMQLTLSPAACRMGHAQLSLPHAYLLSGCPKVTGRPRELPLRSPGGGPAGGVHCAALTGAGGGRAAAAHVLAGAAGCGGRWRWLSGAPGCGPAPRGAPSNQRAPAAWPGARPGRVRGSRGARAAARRPSRFRARCLDAVAVAARAGGFPRAPAPSLAAAPLLPPRSHTQNSLRSSLLFPTERASKRLG